MPLELRERLVAVSPEDLERFRRLETLFHELSELDDGERDERLAALEAEDPSFHKDLKDLLAAAPPDAGSGGVRELLQEEEPEPPPPKTLGPYRLEGLIGEGGMGSVYEAVQESPVRRRVAIKLIRSNLASREIRQRFESERQVLARMQHPCIAQVFDAGEDQGQPYLVMELVEGEPIDRYCEEHELSVDERLRLFLKVCGAVSHAHRKGVLHRDLKPTNILVSSTDDGPVPKVIDFGVSKLLDRDGSDLVQLTQHGQIVGTPQYMSPEQASQDRDVDTRSDVYSLGAVFFELLTGEPPLSLAELQDAGLAEVLRLVREHETPRPSTRVRQSSAALAAPVPGSFSTEAPARAQRLQGDLDWIALRALAKDPGDRYDSPAEFGADIERHLAFEPVRAGKPGPTYVIRKFIRRHRAFSVAVATLAFAVAVGVAGLFVGLRQAQAAEKARAQEAEVAERVANFLTGLFKENDPLTAVEGGMPTAKDILDRGLKRLREDQELKEAPEIRARLLGVIADTYLSLDLQDKSRETLVEALEVFKEIGEPSLKQAQALRLMGMLDLRASDAQGARGWLERADRMLAEVVPPEHFERVVLHTDFSQLAFMEGDSEQALEISQQAVELFEAHHPDAPQLSKLRSSVAVGLCRLGRVQEAIPILEKEVERWRRGEVSDAEIADVLQPLSACYGTLGRLREAKEVLSEGITIGRTLYATNRHHQSWSILTMGRIDELLGNKDESRAAFEETFEILEDRRQEHPAAFLAVQGLARSWYREGDARRARPLFDQAFELSSGLRIDATFSPLRVLRDVAEFEFAQGNVDRARAALARMAADPSRIEQDPLGVGLLQLEQAIYDAVEGNFEAAERAYEESTSKIPPQSRDARLVARRRAYYHLSTANPDQALEQLEELRDLGFRDVWIDQDPSWDSIRQDSRFAPVLAALRPNAGASE